MSKSATSRQAQSPSTAAEQGRAILEASPMPVVLWRAVRNSLGEVVDLAYLDCNRAAVEYLQRDRDTIVGSRVGDFFSQETVAIVSKWVAEVLASGEPLALSHQMFTDSALQERRYDINLGKLDDGAVFMWRDVTDEYEAAEALRKSEESLSVAMHNAPVAMNLTAADGSFLRVNPAMCQFMGRTEDALKSTTWQQLTHPDDLAEDEALAAQVLAGEIDSYRLTKRFLLPDGDVVWGDLSVAAVRAPSGEFNFFVAQIMDVTELVTQREALADSQDHYRLLSENTSDVVMRLSHDGVIEWVSPSVVDVLQWAPVEVVGRRIEEFVATADWTNVAASLAASRSTPEGGDISGQLRVKRRRGRWLWVDAIARSARDRAGRPLTVVRLRDVDEEVRARRELTTSEERFRIAMRNAPIGMALTTKDGVVLQANAALGRMVGREEADLLGTRITSLTHPDDRAVDLEMWNVLHAGRTAEIIREKRLLDMEGREVWVQSAIAAVRDELGGIGSFVVQFLDTTETRQANAALEQLALQDPLTELRNRRAVLEQITTVLDHEPRTGHRLAVLYLDVDRFKSVNDQHGHAIGDLLLQHIGHRISECLREEDTVGRLGGDEFLVLLPGVRDLADTVAVAQKIRAAVSQPVTSDGLVLRPTVSVGAALARPGDSPDDVIARADRALYLAKEGGRDRAVAAPESA